MGLFEKVRKGCYSITTALIHGRFKTPKWDFRHHVVPPISSSTAYRLESAHRAAQGFVEFATPIAHHPRHQPIYIYDRLDEPTRGMLEENLTLVEKGEIAITYASGMAAISSAILSLMSANQRILAHHTLYGCTYSLFTNWLPKWQIFTDFTDFTLTDNIKKNIKENTKIIFFESPVNPSLEIIDIKKVVHIVKKINQERQPDKRIITIVDNTFATPYCQRPLELGIDIVVESLTKNIAGFGTDMGGAIITKMKDLEYTFLLNRKDFGGVLSPKSAWNIMIFGLSTLSLRMRREIDSAYKVASFLKENDKIAKISYPGLETHPHYSIAKRQMNDFDGKFAPGNMIYFVLKGEPEEAKLKCEELINFIAKHSYTITLAVSLGQIRTLIEHPSSMTHAAVPAEEQIKRGIEPGAIRMSIGLENPNDIIRDLSIALDRI